MMLKQAQNSKTRRIKTERVGGDWDESRIGKGKAKMKIPSEPGYLQNLKKEKCRVSIRNND